MKKQKTYPAGRICEGEDCAARLSIYNADHLCARCEDIDRLETQEAEALERLLAQERNNDKSVARHLAGRRPRSNQARRLYVGNGDFVTERP